jgi:hypothetical protein
MRVQNAQWRSQGRSSPRSRCLAASLALLGAISWQQASAATLSAEQQAAFNAATADMSELERRTIGSQIATMSDAQVDAYYTSFLKQGATNPATTPGTVTTGATAPGTASPTPLPRSNVLIAQEASPPGRTEPYDIRRSTRSMRDIEPFISRLASRSLRGSLDGYSAATPLRAELDYRGIKILVSSPANSTSMRLQVADAGIDKTVAERSRDLSLLGIGRYVTAEDSQLVRKLMRAVVGHTTDDPVAGNPASLLGRILATDFRAGADAFSSVGEMARVSFGDWGSASVIGWHQFGGSAAVNTLAVPLTLGHRFTERWNVYAEAVPAVQQIDGRPVYSSMLASGFHYTLIDSGDLRWRAGASARGGIAGSSEVETVGGLLGGAMSTEASYQLRPGLTLSGASTIGHYNALPIAYGPYSAKYDVSNTGFRNGVSVSQAIAPIFGLDAVLTGSIIDSRFTGTPLAVNAWQEYGALVTLGRERPARIGFSYLHGERGVQGVSLRASIDF